MATYNFLDKTGLGQVWAKIKALIPTKTSELTNDSGYITSYTDEKLKIIDIANDSGSNLGYLIFGNGAGAQIRNYDSKNLYYEIQPGTGSTTGTALLSIGNNSVDKRARGMIRLFGANGSYTNLRVTSSGGSKTITFPDKEGTVALTSDITDNNTTYSVSITNNVITLTGSDGNASSVTLPVYNGGVSSI